ncbi:MAG: hypothetical protein ABSG54_07845 [Terriglobia bacterium]
MDIPEAGADTQAAAADTPEAADTLAEEELAAPWAEAESDSPVADVAVLAAWGAVGAGD